MIRRMINNNNSQAKNRIRFSKIKKRSIEHINNDNLKDNKNIDDLDKYLYECQNEKTVSTR